VAAGAVAAVAGADGDSNRSATMTRSLHAFVVSTASGCVTKHSR
jgi:hypothetical protein